MPELPLFAASAFIISFAALVQGATGFGFVIVAAPLITVYLDPQVAIPVLVTIGITQNFLLMADTWRDVRLSRIWQMIVTGVAFTPVGAFFLVTLSAPVLKVLLGVGVGIVALALLFGLQRTARNERLASLPVGAASGILTGATGLTGAPVILFFANQGIEQRMFRANIIFYLQAVSLAALPIFAVAGVLTVERVTLAAALLPAGVTGTLGGIWLARRISTVLFRRAVLVIVLISAIVSTVSGVRS